MAKLKIVIKVTINCGKDKTYLMKAVAKLEGITDISLDTEKGTLTITGDVDPVCVVMVLRKKCGICVEILTVGPAKPPEAPKKETPKDPPKCNPVCLPPPCHPPICDPCPPRHCDYDGNSCVIL